MKKQLIIKGLKIIYPGKRGFADCHIMAAEGDVVAIIGESGCGKTSLLNAVAGYMKKIDNNVYRKINIKLFNNISLGEYAVESLLCDFIDISYLPQNSILFENSTIYKNVLIGLSRIKDTYVNELKKNMRNGYNLSNDISDYISDLSGGERQRVAILRTMTSVEQGLYLLDEPFNGLDKLNKKKVAEQIFKKIKDSNSLCLFVSHDIHDILDYANKFLIFEKQDDDIFKCHYFNSLEELCKSDSEYINKVVYAENFIIIKINEKDIYITPGKVRLCASPPKGSKFVDVVIDSVNKVYDQVKVAIKIKNIKDCIDKSGNSGNSCINEYKYMILNNCHGFSVGDKCYLVIND
jgi:ABC-type nitrate/sulfonate/bicarbonate transport system ATPase subunit